MNSGRSSLRLGLVAASCTTAIACLLLQATAFSQAVTPTAPLVRGGVEAGPLSGFDAYVTKTIQEWRTPGLAIAVVKDGQIVFSKGYGVRELGKPEPVDTHTLFAIGSTTKAMTAALVGMLVDEKKLGWDDPVVKHLPWFQAKDPYLTREITVRDLLTHRAGLGNADYLWYGQTISPREILERVRLLEPSYSLRSSFIYQM
jgi:CubicO group peptidase (beta-lactamase class C family)